jgi:hypothetical protein
MGKVTNFGWAPPHAPIYGIDHSNIAVRLTRLNWRKKAVCRIYDDTCLYIHISRGRFTENGRKHEHYFVRIAFGKKETKPFEKDFPKLNDALAYVNGEDGSEFGRVTRIAETWEYPKGCYSDTFITGLGGSEGNLLPNFTIRVPGAPRE